MTTAATVRFDLDAHLAAGIRRRMVDNGNGLTMNLLEAGDGDGDAPCLLLLHGFPELAFSWRRVMPALAAAGYYVIAPDQRGYGWTTGWTARYEDDLGPFKMLNLVQDQLGLLGALGCGRVTAVIGHDFGAPVAAYCGLVRPDVFPAVVCMSAPFGGPPRLSFGAAAAPVGVAGVAPSIHDDLANLARPRKHYQWYYSTADADADMRLAPQGLHAFLRAYYHHKSADWAANKPYPLAGWTADELAKLPTYYIMDLAQTMPEAVAAEMPSAAEIAACAWHPTPIWRSTPRPMRPMVFRAACNGIAAPPARPWPRKCACSPDALSMSQQCSSPAPPIGAFIKSPAILNACEPPPAPISAAAT